MLDPFDIGNSAGTLIMHNYVKASRPILLLVRAELVIFTLVVTFVNDRPGNICPFADSLGQDLFLGRVIVTTAPRDHQGAQRFRAISRNRNSEEQQGGQTSRL